MKSTRTWHLLAFIVIAFSFSQANASLDDIATLIKANFLQTVPNTDYPSRPSLKLKNLTNNEIKSLLEQSGIKNQLTEHFPSLCASDQGWKTIMFLFEEFRGVGNTTAVVQRKLLVNPNDPDDFKNFETKLYDAQHPIPASEVPDLIPGALRNIEWCEGCPEASTDKRITLILDLIDKTIQKFPDLNNQISYTSFGSGELLQDYLTIATMITYGYTNILVNIIDQIYEISQTLSIQKSSNLNDFYKDDNYANLDQNYFVFLKDFIIDLRKINVNTTFTISKNTIQFNEFVSKNHSAQSNIVHMIDPGEQVKGEPMLLENDPNKIDDPLIIDSLNLLMIKLSPHDKLQVIIPSNIDLKKGKKLRLFLSEQKSFKDYPTLQFLEKMTQTTYSNKKTIIQDLIAQLKKATITEIHEIPDQGWWQFNDQKYYYFTSHSYLAFKDLVDKTSKPGALVYQLIMNKIDSTYTDKIAQKARRFDEFDNTGNMTTTKYKEIGSDTTQNNYTKNLVNTLDKVESNSLY